MDIMIDMLIPTGFNKQVQVKDSIGEIHFGRQFRQREIIRAVIQEGASLSSLGNYEEILAALGGNFKTNLTLDKCIISSLNIRKQEKI